MSKQVGVSIICPECKNQFYPTWLRHLQSAKKRMFYAMLPCIALLIFVDLNGEAPRAPSVSAPKPGYDMEAIFDEVMGAAPQGIPAVAPTGAPPAPIIGGMDPELRKLFDETLPPIDPNAPTAARVQQALTDAEGTKPGKAYDYLVLLNWARAANGRAAPAAGKAFGELGQIVLGILVTTALAFALLTLVHTAASMYKPWSMLSKPFRMYWFFSACWVFAVTLFVMVFDPYKIGGLSEMGTDQYSHMFSIEFVIPIFIGLSFYVYQRYVK